MQNYKILAKNTLQKLEVCGILKEANTDPCIDISQSWAQQVQDFHSVTKKCDVFMIVQIKGVCYGITNEDDFFA